MTADAGNREMEKIEQSPQRKMLEGPGPRSHTSYNEAQGQPTPTAPYAKDCQYGPPPTRGSSPACRPYAKDCQYGPPPTLGLSPAGHNYAKNCQYNPPPTSESTAQIPPSKDDTTGNGKAKGADHPTITEAPRDRQDKLTGARTAPGRGKKESEIKASNAESLRQRRPPGKGAFNGGRLKQSKRAEDHGLRPLTPPPPWRVNPDGDS